MNKPIKLLEEGLKALDIEIRVWTKQNDAIVKECQKERGSNYCSKTSEKY